MNRTVAFLLVGTLLLGCCCLTGLGVVIVTHALPTGDFGLAGTNVTERDLSPDRQRQLLNEFSPIPIPATAIDITITYQRFQDWYFEGSFTLPPNDLDAFVKQLEPLPPTAGGPVRYHGKVIGRYEGVVERHRTEPRITIRHTSQ